MRIITIANQKGGAGKTTSTLNIGAGLAKKGKRVLLIDMDSQINLSIIFSSYQNEHDYTMADIYDENANIGLDKIYVKIKENLYIAKASKLLSGAEKGNQSGDEWVLYDKIEELKDDFDYILIDTPPMNGFLTVSALLAATDIIIPAETDLYSFQGADSFFDSLDKIKKRNNPDLNILGMIITRLKSQTISGKEMIDEYTKLCEAHGTKIIGMIPDNIAIRDSQLALQDIFAYAPDSKGAEAYMEVVNYILKET